jgi:hypothetical protein
VNVKFLRFRIASVMVFVAIIGFNCWAIQTILEYRSWIVKAGIGGLPMAHILIIVPLVSFPYRGCRRFLLGFEVFGAAAVILCLALMIHEPPFFLRSYNQRLVINPLVRAWGVPMNWRDSQWLICGLLQSLLVTLPQLAFALIGGFLFRNVWQPTRKQPSTSSPLESQNSGLSEF